MGYIGRAFLRSFLIQSSWSFERMQTLGFLYSIAPAIRTIYKNKEGLKKAYRRHMEFFNTNPYMAPAIIGATIKMEEDGASDEDIRGLKVGLMGAYGAVGDSLFWGSLRPLAAVVGVVFALNASFWAPIVFLAIYNVPHIFIRSYGMLMGYRTGMGVVKSIKELDIPAKVQQIKSGILFAAGFILSLTISMVALMQKGMGGALISLIFIFSVFGFYWVLEKGIRVEWLAFLAVPVSLVLGLFI